jgi:hypothetical protein
MRLRIQSALAKSSAFGASCHDSNMFRHSPLLLDQLTLAMRAALLRRRLGGFDSAFPSGFPLPKDTCLVSTERTYIVKKKFLITLLLLSDIGIDWLSGLV